MQRTTLLSIATLAIVGASATAGACPFCKAKTSGLFIGESALMGAGTVRSWVDIGKDGKPVTIGVTLNKLALQDLPAANKDGMPPEFLVALPKEAKALTPFDHVGINWMAQGHEPAPIYDKAHFDFHFYTVPTSARSMMKATSPAEKAKLTRMPMAGTMPKGYIMAPGAEMPYMGAHWVDTASPELKGAPFTSTMILGSYEGKLAFLEPMVAMSMLEAKEGTVRPIGALGKVEKSGFYPTEYAVEYDARREEYSVTLRKFVWRAADRPVAKRTAKR